MWTPPPRPDWVLAINRGEIWPIAEEAAQPLEADRLLAEAAARQGRGLGNGPAAPALETLFGHPDHPAEAMIERLQRLSRALEEEAELNVIGRALTRRFLLRVLEVRLQILAALRRDPGLADQEIAAPVFVAGAPRTGTTILFELLSLDRSRRAPLGWELLRPVPSPTPGGDERARIALAQQELVAPQTVASGIQQIHAYGAQQPKECLSAMTFALQSEEFSARYHIPSYSDWLVHSDMTPAYAMHRLVLQILQRRQPETRWLLKSPVHLHALDTLFATYPDVQVAIPHRDPLVFLSSLRSLICHLRWAHSDVVDPARIGEEHHARYTKTLNRLAQGWTNNAWPRDQIHHSLFADFQTNPVSVVDGLYDQFGWTLSDDDRERLLRHPAVRKKGPVEKHHYTLAYADQDPAAARRDFERYLATFSVPSDA